MKNDLIEIFTVVEPPALFPHNRERNNGSCLQRERHIREVKETALCDRRRGKAFLWLKGKFTLIAALQKIQKRAFSTLNLVSFFPHTFALFY